MKWWFPAIAALLLAGTRVSAQDRDYGHDAAMADNVKTAWADVLRVDPVYERAAPRGVREVCDEMPAPRYVDGGNNNAAGGVIGAIIGGVLGNSIGHGDGRRAATVAGAMMGGAIGSGVARGDDGYYEGYQRRCRLVSDGGGERELVSYEVQYRYRGDIYVSRLGYDPGDRLRVRVSIEPAE